MVAGLSGTQMLIALFIGIALLIFLVLKTKVQAFLAIIIAACTIGLIGGMPLVTQTLDDGTKFGIINSISTGFGNTLASIGIIIGFGVMMGEIFEKTGAAKDLLIHFSEFAGKTMKKLHSQQQVFSYRFRFFVIRVSLF